MTTEAQDHPNRLNALRCTLYAGCTLYAVRHTISAVRYKRIEYPLIYVPIRHLYICREASTNQPFLCKTNPISEKAQMNLKIFVTRNYENISDWTLGENKPNQSLSCLSLTK